MMYGFTRLCTLERLMLNRCKHFLIVLAETTWFVADGGTRISNPCSLSRGAHRNPSKESFLLQVAARYNSGKVKFGVPSSPFFLVYPFAFLQLDVLNIARQC